LIKKLSISLMFGYLLPNGCGCPAPAQQFQIQNILPILYQRSIVSGGVGQVCLTLIVTNPGFLA
jgi:hypothetical protein